MAGDEILKRMDVQGGDVQDGGIGRRRAGWMERDESSRQQV